MKLEMKKELKRLQQQNFNKDKSYEGMSG